MKFVKIVNDKEKYIDYEIKPINQKNRKEVNEILIEEWEETNIISRGKIIDGTKLNGFVAIQDRKIVGLITYQIENQKYHYMLIMDCQLEMS